MNGWITVVRCPYCGGADFAKYKSVVTAPVLRVDFLGGDLPVQTVTQYVSCLTCGLIIQSPRMADERISDYYSSGMYRKTLGISQEEMDTNEQGRAADVAAWLGYAPESHLDIGCSRGYFLQSVGAKKAHGFDENPAYAEVDNVFSKSGDLGFYELVSSLHVLEHTIDPMAELRWYKSLSVDKVLIEVPGANCRGGPLRFAHLFYFPPALLEEMVESAGMKIERIDANPNTRILARVNG